MMQFQEEAHEVFGVLEGPPLCRAQEECGVLFPFFVFRPFFDDALCLSPGDYKNLEAKKKIKKIVVHDIVSACARVYTRDREKESNKRAPNNPITFISAKKYTRHYKLYHGFLITCVSGTSSRAKQKKTRRREERQRGSIQTPVGMILYSRSTAREQSTAAAAKGGRSSAAKEKNMYHPRKSPNVSRTATASRRAMHALRASRTFLPQQPGAFTTLRAVFVKVDIPTPPPPSSPPPDYLCPFIHILSLRIYLLQVDQDEVMRKNIKQTKLL